MRHLFVEEEQKISSLKFLKTPHISAHLGRLKILSADATIVGSGNGGLSSLGRSGRCGLVIICVIQELGSERLDTIRRALRAILGGELIHNQLADNMDAGIPLEVLGDEVPKPLPRMSPHDRRADTRS